MLKGPEFDRLAHAFGSYRYDGLYEVKKAWMEQGLNKGGFKVCKYAFVVCIIPILYFVTHVD